MVRVAGYLSMGVIALLLGSASLTSCAPVYYPAPAGVYGWDAEEPYWRANYINEPYYTTGFGYAEYQPAYMYGVETYNRYPGRRFEELNDAELRSRWEGSHGRGSHLDWEHARAAAHAAYNHRAQSGRGDWREHRS